jgi:hypothetical protein
VVFRVTGHHGRQAERGEVCRGGDTGGSWASSNPRDNTYCGVNARKAIKICRV